MAWLWDALMESSACSWFLNHFKQENHDLYKYKLKQTLPSIGGQIYVVEHTVNIGDLCVYVYGQIYEVEHTVNKGDLCVYVYGQI